MNANSDISEKNAGFIPTTWLIQYFLNCYSKDIEQNKDADAR
jgi:hypothetical protein